MDNVEITKLDVPSVARRSAALYALVGFSFSVLALVQTNRLYCPLGIVLPYVHLNINLDLPIGTSVPVNFLLVLLATACYAITGALSACAVVVAYNVTSKYWGGIKGICKVEPSSSRWSTANTQ